ncbi:hypothetical protein, partial [Pseudomonas bubulae]|uniref:hypothetical protein n=1 Tax=Pseudomonas bubulae TaxID=2316085 RepID=UPI0030A53549
FFQLEELQALNAKIDGLLKNVEALKEYLAGQPFIDRLIEYLTSNEDPLNSVYVEEQNIDGINNLDIDSFGISINYAQADKVKVIEFSNPTYIDNGHYSLDVELATTAAIHYCADYMDYIQLSQQRSKNIDQTSMNGDGVCDLSEDFLVILQGTVEVFFDGGWSAQELDTHSVYLNTKKTKIGIILNIESGTILNSARS